MAMDNLKDFSNEWVLFGLLFFCLASFSLAFISNNNPTAMGDSYDKISGYNTNIQSNLIDLDDDTDALLNITSNTNPEAGDLGSRDSVATSYGITGTGKSFFTNTKAFMQWIIGDTVGKILIVVIGGIIGLMSLYFITKWIRNGI